MKSIFKKIICAVLALSMLIASAGAVFASAAENAGKQEVVYVNLDTSGAVKEIYVVNIFEMDDEGQIVDYGDYEELRNMTGNEEIEFHDQKVSIYSKDKTLYYEGKFKSNVTPWIFDFRYFINGKEVKGTELGGKTGALQIILNIRKNPEHNLGFFENYTLQMSFQMDSKKASNIVAKGATIANVGRKKQFTYMVFPNTEATYEITADVKDFEMSAISINGLKMGLELDETMFTQNSVLTSSLQQLEDGIVMLDNGAAQIRDNAKLLSDGAYAVYDGIRQLYSGADALYSGADTLYSGTKALKDGQTTVVDASKQLYNGASDMEWAVDALTDGAGTLYQGMNTLSSSGTELRSTAKTLADATLQMNQQLLADAGYPVTSATSFETISSYLESRQVELIGSSAMSECYAQGIRNRIAHIESLLAGNLSDTERQYYEDAWLYWEISLFGLLYADSADADMLSQLAVVGEFSDMLLKIGGLNMIEDYYDELSNTEMAVKEYDMVYESITELATQMVMADEIYQVLALIAFCSGVGRYVDGVDTARSGAYTLASSMAQLRSGASALTAGSKALYNGLGEIQNGIKQLASGAEELKKGANTLKQGVSAVEDGAYQVYSGSVALYEGCIQLKDGTNELRVNVAGNGKKLYASVIESIGEMFGAEFVAPSYTDSRNDKAVEFVQFVFQTDPFTMPDVTVQDVLAPQLTFWQKIMKLFGANV